MQSLFNGQQCEEESEWISISDLMTGLAIIFIFIAITYIRPLITVQNTVKNIVVTWQESELEIYRALKKEFSKDLKKWDAEIDKETLTIRFKSPRVLFDTNRSQLKPEFEEILRSFFPRYLAVLARFRKKIDEVRIEGHTSSEWNEDTEKTQAYFNNMKLSQGRTRAVLEYALSLPKVRKYREWAKSNVTANGMSSSRLVYNKRHQENPVASRRVEFRVRTNSKEQIIKILEAVK